LEGGWKQIDNIHSRFCKVILGMPRSAANNVAELELGRGSRRGKVLNRIVKYWLRLLGMDSSELVKICYEWQMNNLKVDGWAKKLKEELDKMGLTYI
jgi:1,2-phenylacetyl-CoA epoxidase catalytic subunit